MRQTEGMTGEYEVVKVSATGRETVVAGWLTEHQADVLRKHYEVGCLEGETVKVREGIKDGVSRPR